MLLVRNQLFKTILLLLLSTSQIAFGEEKDWNRWSVHNVESTDVVRYGPYNTILRTLIDNSTDIPSMRYSVLQGPKPFRYIETFINYLQNIPVSQLNSDEQYAYWLNLHNLGVIQLLVIENGLKSKMKKARGLPGAPGAQWAESRFTVEGQSLSLEEIEQKIIFTQWPNPQSLYGLSYGVRGSPAISKIAYTGKNVHARLQLMGKRFLKTDGILKIKKDKVTLSSLYVWNKATLFQNSDKAVFAHLEGLVTEGIARKLSRQLDIDKDKFSWRSVGISSRSALSNQPISNRRGGGS
ncbi:MAG: hypothetical protein ACI9FB_003353 [Candidatus Azotimanducaceae bacterium]|jgi:hypothetical protein